MSSAKSTAVNAWVKHNSIETITNTAQRSFIVESSFRFFSFSPG
uniref:Uncharacterized protein n=1 Tax=Anopheles atroparvus TaxID=41427 RepID=A0AAG5D869_ANOAO